MFDPRDYDYDEERAWRDEQEEIARAAEERREEERRLEAMACDEADADEALERFPVMPAAAWRELTEVA